MTTKEEEVKPLDETIKQEEDVSPTAPKKPKVDYGRILKYTSLVVLVLQNAGQVLIMRYATTRQEKFLKTVAVFFAEIVKLVASFFLLNFSNKSFMKTLKDMKYHFFTNWLDTFKVGVPALVYTIQNFLLYVAVENLEAATYMVTYQIKILTTAVFTVFMLKRKLSLLQWLSLVILIVGVALVQLNAKQTTVDPTAVSYFNETEIITSTMSAKEAAAKHGNPIIGLTTVLIACILSGFAGIYFEKILKGSKVSVWMRNIQLAALSIPIAAIMIVVKDRDSVHQNGLMQGFDWVVWAVVLCQALGGLVVAVVIKYADNILKGFATSIAIIVGTVAGIYFFSNWPKPLFIGGAVLVIAAVIVYSAFPYKKKTPPEIEMEEKTAEQKQ
ncbi:hypothetical protein FO519_000364 [Halicephalobus sp. NKZ332]|nr:hypothetical protein FO519_000364 [Halicephalobus sp. NKZ332]